MKFPTVKNGPQRFPDSRAQNAIVTSNHVPNVVVVVESVGAQCGMRSRLVCHVERRQRAAESVRPAWPTNRDWSRVR